jgi:hypothetical protein
MATLKGGTRLKSAVCDTQVMVIAAPAGDVALTCGGSAMLEAAANAPRGALDPEHKSGTQIGKRYVNEDASLELLCRLARARRQAAQAEGSEGAPLFGLMDSAPP